MSFVIIQHVTFSNIVTCTNANVGTTPTSTTSFASALKLVDSYHSNNFMVSSEEKKDSSLSSLSSPSSSEYLSACPANPQEMRMETDITVVTLNCWGIRFVSKDRVARMTAIAEELATGKYDFVFLQEVWTTEDYERIKSRTGDVLPYSHYFFSGVIGAGICIFSKSPIKSAFFHQWAVNGYIHKIQHGDWFGGKGIGMVEVDHRGLTINLYTTHLHAEYDRTNDEYLAHRVTQAFDTAQFISLTSKHADAVIVGGDLNTEPGDLAYRLIVHTAQLQDACEEIVSKSKSASKELMNTCETARNSYSSPNSLKLNPFGKRIDYIAYKGGSNVNVSALSCETSWPDRVPGQPFSYSDHEAVVTKLKVSKSDTNAKVPVLNEAKTETLEESIEICNLALNHLQTSKNMYILLSLAMFVILSMTANLELTGYLSPVVPILRAIILLIFFFGIFMSVIWHRMEVHGILSGKLGMLIELGRPIAPDAEVLPENSVLIGGGDEKWTEVYSNSPQDCFP
ncbi:putative neutral sphingomyelinase [Orchesella cincta]|uniref:sphingomyelin phosphodiesterase n=1 Tax=Orchesella cincta TaxID=48709 RepID=A0A1D2MWX7_ORCCI|nr:putative neutral sphingomyelinase [Orchesella cincta]